VTLFDGRHDLRGQSVIVLGIGVDEGLLDLRGQRALVALECQQRVAAAGEDQRGNLGLTALTKRTPPPARRVMTN
jgi:hypothetical protein